MTASATAGCNSVDIEVVACLADSKSFNKTNGLDFWLSETAKFLVLAPFVQDLLSADKSTVYMKTKQDY